MITGTYRLKVKGHMWLSDSIENVVFNGNGASGLGARLIPGDLDGDNAIGLSDFSLVRSAFGSTASSANWNPNANLNGDGAVGLADFAIIRANFGRTGE
jgi:hypothetical protein